MFCFQCQETAKGEGCSTKGVCGKPPEVANLQDLLIYLIKGIAISSKKADDKGIDQTDVNKFIIESLFATITNGNFNDDYFIDKIKEAIKIRDGINQEAALNPEELYDCQSWSFDSDDDIIEKSKHVGVLHVDSNEDLRSLKELITYGIKGFAAYADHAYVLGYTNSDIFSFVKRGLEATVDENQSADDLTALALETGKYAVESMALLDEANTSTYGTPEVTKVSLGVGSNPSILVSGHDLKDLEELLEQTKGTGVDVYTHGEMLPAHYYPFFKKYDNFVGNYGNSWWKQKEEFEAFNGPILLTTNCLVPPKESYLDRLYTTGNVSYKGANHISDRKEGGTKDFSQLIEQAKKCSPPEQLETGEIVGGFAKDTILSYKDTILSLVNQGKIKKFVVMAGCDGRFKSREYYTEFAENLPSDTVILTAGCAKYRYNKLDLGDIDGIPRILDAGQCNDSYSLAVVAMKLQEVLELDDINDLPIVYNVAWYEQKACTVLLALLHLGIKNIHLGPTLPAFLSENITNVLVKNFNMGTISDAQSDISKMIG